MHLTLFDWTNSSSLCTFFLLFFGISSLLSSSSSSLDFLAAARLLLVAVCRWTTTENNNNFSSHQRHEITVVKILRSISFYCLIDLLTRRFLYHELDAEKYESRSMKGPAKTEHKHTSVTILRLGSQNSGRLHTKENSQNVETRCEHVTRYLWDWRRKSTRVDQ